MSEPIRVGIDTSTDEVLDDNPLSILEELREELSTDVEVQSLHLTVPMRESIRVIYRPVFDLDDMKRWQKASREKPNRSDSEISQKKFFYLVLAETCVGVQIKSKKTGEWVDAKDPNTRTALTFKSGLLSEMLKCIPGWYATIEKMYSNDGHVVMTAKAIMDAAGFGDYELESDDLSPLGG